MRFSRLSPGVVCLLLSVGISRAQAPDDAAALAAKIDGHLVQRLEKAGVSPAPPAADAEFARRIYLDLIGRIPTAAEARSILADRRADRRRRLIDKLLASPRYSTHLAAIYRALLIPEAGNNFLVRFQQANFEDWLRQRLANDAGLDKITHDLLTVPLGGGGPLAGLNFGGGASPIAFYAAKEYKAESLAAGAARVFLGVRVECAQCHHHPFAPWKKEQFWSLAAFFAGIQSQKAGDVLIPAAEKPHAREIAMPGTDTIIKAKFLDGKQPNWDKLPSTPTRKVLADWITARSNPYFARATVNRTWAYFLGAGLVEPIDDMVGEGAVAAHPEVLELLAREFAAHQFDLKFLIRAITLTKAYQRTSAGTDKKQGEPHHFARMPLRGLTPEQLFDSLVTATGFSDKDGTDSLLGAITGNPSARANILSKFANLTERPTMAQTSILHALTLMNGKIVADATSLSKSETLAALVDAPFLSTSERIETLYLAALARRPRPREMDRMTRFVDDAVQAARESRRTAAYNDAIADVFWALLNSSEFALNH